MSNLKYIFQRMLDMNYKAMFQKINSIHKKTGKGRIAIFRDMKDCAVKYGAGYMDYDLFEMYDLTPEQRDTYITRGRQNELVKKYNDLSYSHCFDNKDEFNTLFGEYLKRDWVRVNPENKAAVLAFLEKHPVFIAKPLEGSCGRGVEKLSTADFASLEACYEHLYEPTLNNILEEVIPQHPQVSAVYPHSINTVRAVTINHKGTVHLVATMFRIGNGGKFVDNFNNGGMVTPVDETNGTIRFPAIDKQKNVFEVHPQTGTPIVGFRFPYWEETVAMVKKAATVVPQMAYLGWDVAITPDGPVLVEGNNFPGHDLYQHPVHTPDKLGMMPKFRIED